MNIKKLIFVILVAITAALVYVYGDKIIPGKKEAIVLPKITNSVSTPEPKITPFPIDQTSNLEEEINKLSVNDYSEEFSKLHSQILQF